jgi:hypothetical protein
MGRNSRNMKVLKSRRNCVRSFRAMSRIRIIDISFLSF